ncbi:C-type lectin domain-containing protein [Caenorhabditis elegans]|uniref:C-type lectin domain-containing protein n=1 Tax=Caenorhabditis elegans TaxID=6239 RepID=Q19800_CAEEL|nr:C-type lectin domain-containing protein [Caenorhabditis elegans]CCD66802.2 C-type lectin domain-containing protein [Caenorhabditis elegans]|eukprot:NP_498001.2 C-type LECtin [Caenorhabditis elegans]
MQLLKSILLVGLIIGIAKAILFDDSDSSDESHESYSGGGRSHHHNHRPPSLRPPRPPRPPSPSRPQRPPPSRPQRPPPPRQPRCEAGWTLVQRQNGGWCIRIFQGITNQPQSEAICNQNGARLSAVESQREREIVRDLGTKYMTTTSNWKQGSLRLGMQRANVQSAFLPTDQNARGVDGIRWTPNEPRPGESRWGYYNCVLMWMKLPGAGAVEQRQHGEMFAKVCHQTWTGAFRASFVVNVLYNLQKLYKNKYFFNICK